MNSFEEIQNRLYADGFKPSTYGTHLTAKAVQYIAEKPIDVYIKMADVYRALAVENHCTTNSVDHCIRYAMSRSSVKDEQIFRYILRVANEARYDRVNNPFDYVS